MQKLCCVCTRQHSLPVWIIFATKSPPYLHQFSTIFGGNCIRYLGVPIRDKSYMFGHNRSVVTSSTIPNSTISKRHHLASYHRVREAIAAKFISFHWKDGKATLLTSSANIGSLQLSGLCSSLSCSGGARLPPS